MKKKTDVYINTADKITHTQITEFTDQREFAAYVAYKQKIIEYAEQTDDPECKGVCAIMVFYRDAKSYFREYGSEYSTFDPEKKIDFAQIITPEDETQVVVFGKYVITPDGKVNANWSQILEEWGKKE